MFDGILEMITYYVVIIVRLNVVNLIFITIDLINRESTLHIIARFSDPNIEVLIWYMAVFTAVDVIV